MTSGFKDWLPSGVSLKYPQKIQRFQRISEILNYLTRAIAWRRDTSPIDRGKVIQNSIAKELLRKTVQLTWSGMVWQRENSSKNYIRNKEIYRSILMASQIHPFLHSQLYDLCQPQTLRVWHKFWPYLPILSLLTPENAAVFSRRHRYQCFWFFSKPNPLCNPHEWASEKHGSQALPSWTIDTFHVYKKYVHEFISYLSNLNRAV